MFGGCGGHANAQGNRLDQFMYAAMLSKARIEAAWAGEEAQVATQEAPKEPAAQAFDPEMLKRLAQNASEPGAPEPWMSSTFGTVPSVSNFSAPMMSASSSSTASPMPASMSPSQFPGFSKEAIEAAASLKRPANPLAATASSSVPLAFRKKPATAAAAGEEEPKPSVPLAFLKKKATVPMTGAAPTASSGFTVQPPTNFIGSWRSGGDEAMGNAGGGMNQAFQQNSGEGGAGGAAEANRTGDDGAAEAKAKAAESAKNLVSSKLEQWKKTAEATSQYHAAAPEPKPVEAKPPRQSRWGSSDQEPVRGDDDKNSDLGFTAKQLQYAEESTGSATKPSDPAALQSISRRELAALARGEPNPDAPVLGELRAPAQQAPQSADDEGFKTGAQATRAKAQHAQGYGTYRSRSRSRRRSRSRGRDRRRSRSRDRRDRRRSRSASRDRGGKRLFTDRPSFRMTGSSFTSAPQKTGNAAPAAPDLKKEELPDWLKDMAEPPSAPAVQLGKKYLHMPRIMVEVLTHNSGEALRACEGKSQCQIRVETLIDEPVGIVSVNGNVPQGESAVREVLANKGLDLPPQDGLVVPYVPVDNRRNDQIQDIQIPDQLVRHFVGHRGSNMKAIHAELDRRHGGARTVSIQILPTVLPGGFRRIQITGSNRAAARELVLQHIEDLKKQNLTFCASNDPINDRMAAVQQASLPPPPPPSGVSI